MFFHTQIKFHILSAYYAIKCSLCHIQVHACNIIKWYGIRILYFGLDIDAYRDIKLAKVVVALLEFIFKPHNLCFCEKCLYEKEMPLGSNF